MFIVVGDEANHRIFIDDVRIKDCAVPIAHRGAGRAQDEPSATIALRVASSRSSLTGLTASTGISYQHFRPGILL